MNAVLDNLLVGAVLLASVAYAVYRLGPRTLKKRIAAALSTTLAAAPPFLKLGAGLGVTLVFEQGAALKEGILGAAPTARLLRRRIAYEEAQQRHCRTHLQPTHPNLCC